MLSVNTMAFSPTRVGRLSTHQRQPLTWAALKPKTTALFEAMQEDDADFLGEDGSGDKNIDIDNLTIQGKLRVLTYRAGLGASALLICVQAIGDVSFLEGTGINVDNVVNVVEQTQAILPIVTGTTLAVCPVPETRIVQLGSSSLGILILISGILSSIIPDTMLLHQLSWTLSIVALMILSIREIYYFGFEYKQECGISLLMLPFMLDVNNQVPFTIPLCALGLSVLAVGKIFEPLREDLIRSNSEFLAK